MRDRGADPTSGDRPDFAAVFAQSGEGLLVCGLDGVAVAANRAFCDLVGRSRGEVLGRPFTDFVESRDRVALVQRLDRLRSGPLRVLRRDTRFVNARGQMVWTALSVSLVGPEDSDDGDGREYFGIQVRDISDAKQLEQMLLDSERRHRTIFSALSEGFAQVDGDGRIVEVNDALCGMLGVGRPDIVGRPLTQFLTGEGAATLAIEMDRRDGHMDRAFGLSFRHAEGREVLTQVYPAGLADRLGAAGGTVTGGFIAVIVDTTERSLAERSLAASEERYRTLVDSMQDGLVQVRDGRLEFANEAAARIVGSTPTALVGRTFMSMVAPEDQPMLADRYERRLRGEALPKEYEVRLLRADGSRAVVNLHTALTGARDGGHMHITTMKDVTERKRIEDELRKLSSALDQSAAAVVITDARGVIEYVNDRFTKLTGWDAAEVLGRPAEFLADADGGPEADAMAKAMQQGRPWKGEARCRRKTGEVYWEHTSIAPVRDARGGITHYVAVKEDITRRKESEARVWQQANYDPVTALPNRVLFQDRLAQSVTRARRRDERLCVMFIDLDRFKYVNDTLGHEAGDELLREVGVRLASCVRESDTVARLAGDEFTVLLPDPGADKDITAVAVRILEALRERFLIAGGREVFVGGSIGVALFPQDGEDAGTLLKNADTAMYRAKENGRNTYQFYTAEMNAEAVNRLMLETDLRRAVEQGELVVHFQPVVDAAARAVTGAEALVRWRHPQRGLVAPGEFLPIAEEIGLIQDIGRMVLRTACAEAAAWHAAGFEGLTVSVNIADRQVTTGRLHVVVNEVLAETGLPAEALAVEVGESLLVRDLPVIDEVLGGISAQGVKLVIDDFGTGYSSLQHLRRFPFRTLKLDRSFVRDVLQDAEDKVLVETVIAMARKLGLSVVAEGVETAAQLEWLLGQYCDLFQGFLFGRPLPPEDFRALLGRPLQEVEAVIG
ncbi:MAG: PAS domain S-box protein [Caenispirillum bisanense]|nr:PAS domain S-box protein [Caenispirillum bisanense]MCA1972986.1 PAS domain S-box protein [Caenispirillum sp.]